MKHRQSTPWLLTLAAAAFACGPAEGPAAFQPTSTPNPNVDPAASLRWSKVTGAQAQRASGPAVTGSGPKATLVRAPHGGRVPDVGGRLFSNAGAFTFPGGTQPGQGSALQAPVIDSFSGTIPTTLGGGSWDVTVGANHFLSGVPESVAEVFVDDTSGVEYLVVSVYELVTDPATGAELGTVLHLIVPSADFAVGAVVNFDGTDRLAFFATGDINLPDPTLAAAAVTGSVTFTAGGLAVGDLISFDLAGDFGEITWQNTPPPPPPVVVGNITPGNYNLTFDPTTYVQCDGTLLGQEPAFSALTLVDLGFVDGPVVITQPAAQTLELAGPSLVSAYGQANVVVEATPDVPPGTYAAIFQLQSGVGPAGTDRLAAYLLLDDGNTSLAGVPAQAGVYFGTPDGLGGCSVDVGAALVP